MFHNSTPCGAPIISEPRMRAWAASQVQLRGFRHLARSRRLTGQAPRAARPPGAPHPARTPPQFPALPGRFVPVSGNQADCLARPLSSRRTVSLAHSHAQLLSAKPICRRQRRWNDCRAFCTRREGQWRPAHAPLDEGAVSRIDWPESHPHKHIAFARGGHLLSLHLCHK